MASLLLVSMVLGFGHVSHCISMCGVERGHDCWSSGCSWMHVHAEC